MARPVLSERPGPTGQRKTHGAELKLPCAASPSRPPTAKGLNRWQGVPARAGRAWRPGASVCPPLADRIEASQPRWVGG